MRGLGQIITEAPVTSSDRVDFCSRIMLRDHGIFFGRDLIKTLTHRQFYTKNNQAMLLNPYHHVKAIYDSIKSEKSSKLLEEMIEARLRLYTETDRNLSLVVYKTFNCFEINTEYRFEEVINNYLDVCISDLIKLLTRGVRYS